MATKRNRNNKGRKAAQALDYDATKTTGRRRRPSSRLAAEHVILPQYNRGLLLSTVQDQQRNAALAAWMIRRHLDYVSRFKFLFQHDNEPLMKKVNALFDWHAQPVNFDIAGRFGREQMFRMFEMEKTVSGDAAMIKLSTGHLQGIEADMIALPKIGKMRTDGKTYDPIPVDLLKRVSKDTGMVMDFAYPGRIAQFCICNRGHDGAQVSFDHLEDATNVIFDGYFTRLSSQVRGISPLSTAVNLLQDVYEGIDFNLAKAKLHALFGIAIMRDYTGWSDQQEVDGWGGASGITTGADENKAHNTTESTDGTKTISATVQAVKPSEMMLIDMDTKGRIETIESKTPSGEFVGFTTEVIRILLLALDIPYSAMNSAGSSFSGLIADQNLYEVSCRSKRDQNLWKRIEYSNWLIEREWESERWGLAALAAAAGIKSHQELAMLIEWVPAGFPWLQKLQEVQGDIKAISVGLDNPIDACKRRGVDFHENVLKTERAYKFAKAHDVPLMIGEPGQAAVAEVEEMQPSKPPATPQEERE